MLIQIVLFDGFDMLDVIAPYEVLEAGASLAAKKDGASISIEFVSAQGPGLVRAGALKNPENGLLIEATAQLNPSMADLIVVPGALGEYEEIDGPNSIPAILGRAATGELAVLLEEAMVRHEVTVATVCGGSLILGMTGLIQGRNAVTHHIALPMLEAMGVNVIDARVVDDGDLISGGGVTSGLDVGIYLVERFLGSDIALSIEKLMEYERRGVAWRK
ncbi:DJ-1/PfpI family protein [Acidovorax sp. CCYZU-2555]|uniref:DJ-1/PfpI family protein n=1 Tax=Acidovorax sp. CCYZU-2555 TaxID=2835042 RepID=UPI001BCE5245|nr:DJ-1/PfpI family protein [Acidovorax sp. CCYZU-2555]MBS7776834.1 DJ-1/PfpI family protein [Acidovorax sp. CCYZU-2555]